MNPGEKQQKRPKPEPLATLNPNQPKLVQSIPAAPRQLRIDMTNLPGVKRLTHRENQIFEIFEGSRRELASLQKIYQADPNYLSRHPRLNARMRAILWSVVPFTGWS